MISIATSWPAWPTDGGSWAQPAEYLRRVTSSLPILSWGALNEAPTKLWESASSEAFRLCAMVFLAAMFAYVSFYPMLKMCMRYPFRKCAGMDFGDFKISPLSLSFAFTDVEIWPVESPVLKGLFAALFPSAIVRTYEKSEEYPGSKIAVETVRIGIRMRSIVGASDGDANALKTISRWAKQLWHIIFQRPIISVKLHGVTLEVEKAYVAPPPPPEFHTAKGDTLPSAIPAEEPGPEIPVFDLDYIMDFLREDEVRDADCVTFWMERWIQHAVNSINGAGGNARNDRTADERLNARIRYVAIAVLHSISIQLTDASIIISGASAELVKETRAHCGPRETNAILANLPKWRRALTIIGTESISISCTPDSQCSLVILLASLHVKVGDPLPGLAKSKSLKLSTEFPYVWQTIAHPFDVALELTGLVPIIVWAVNYDHHWPTRTLALNLNASEIAVNLSPSHLQTAIMHLDDFVDPLSSFNEWFQWLQSHHQQTLLGLNEHDRLDYCRNYAMMKGAQFDSDGRTCQRLTVWQMKEMERRTTRYELISLRCIAMERGWRVPKVNNEFEAFLRGAQSRMCDKGEEDRATPLSVVSPFQRRYESPLHCLAVLTREKCALLSPGVSINFSARTLQNDFCEEGKPMHTPVPSTLTMTGLSFGLEYLNTLWGSFGNDASMLRPLVNMSIQARGMRWDVADAYELDLPTFPNKTPVGIIYEQCQRPSQANALDFEMRVAVAPTRSQDPFISVDLQSSDRVFVINPLPLIWAAQTLLDFSDIPFCQLEDGTAHSSQVGTEPPATIVSTDVNVSVENTNILLLTDRKEILRGVLDLELNDFAVKFQSRGMTGDLEVSVPTLLHAGEVVHEPSPSNAGIRWRNMPFKPLIMADGAKLVASFKDNCKDSNAPPHPETSEASLMCIDVEILAPSFLLNASPSTLVASIGAVTSLTPFLDWTQGDTEEQERKLLEKEKLEQERERANLFHRRKALQDIFNSVDINRSGTLQEDELDRVVLMLFAESLDNANGAQRLTAEELKRERDHLIRIVDSGHTNQVMYAEVDSILFRIANKIDDNHLSPDFGATGVDYLDRYAHSTAFLSAPSMRKLIYFDDLREFSGMHEVYRITGYAMRASDSFPAPNLWHNGHGEGLFWDLYNAETGCSRHSLNGQDISSVQRKLVRSLCNYQFAKFCWKTLVQPQLLVTGSDGEAKKDCILTSWVLDNDPQARINAGVIDRLLRHIDRMAEETKEEMELEDTHFNITISIAVDNATFQFGSSHTFTNPLLEANCSESWVQASALVSSQSMWFVPLDDNEVVAAENGNMLEGRDGNEFRFRSMLSVRYLNTKHNNMETFVESYPSFGVVAYQTFFQEGLRFYGENPETSSFAVNVNCPRTLSINALPTFFETVSVLSNTIVQLDPDSFYESVRLSQDEALEVLNADGRWKEEALETFGHLDGNRNEVPLRNVKPALEIIPGSYFAGCRQILVQNHTGRHIRVGTDEDSLHQSVDPNGAAAISLCNSRSSRSQCHFSVDIDRFKLIRGVVVSPYQSGMLPLIRSRTRHRLKRERKHLSASGFSPFLTVVPKHSSLDSISLTLRPCVTIQTEIPIRIRIVRLPKSKLSYLKKRGTKSAQLDLGKKNLAAALGRAVDGALIVYEKEDVERGVEAAVPLNILDSSSYHALLIGDNQQRCHWRDPILLTKSFLFNPDLIREVCRCQALSGIVIERERLNICLHNKHYVSKSANSDDMKSILRRTAWDTTIRVVPFFRLMNSMPFPILARTWQLPRKEDDSDWRDTSLLMAQAENDRENVSDDEDLSSATPSTRGGRGLNPDQFHQPFVSRGGYFAIDSVERGGTLRLSGVSLREPLFIQLAQHLQISDDVDELDSMMWSKPVKIKLAKLRTGLNPNRGSFVLPRIPVQMSETCDGLLDVSIDSTVSRVPVATLYAPYWVMNKTGAKLAYKTGLKVDSGRLKRYADSGCGGLPIMFHCGSSEKELSLVPIEPTKLDVASIWWDEASNGKLVLSANAIKNKLGHPLVKWSDTFSLDTAGTSGEVRCKQFIFSCSIERLAGAFHRTNLVTLSARFVLKNVMHIPITIIPLWGGKNDARRKAVQLRHALTEEDEERKMILNRNESTIIYSFADIAIAKGIERSYRWVAFSVNAERQRDGFKSKWHLIPLDKIGSTYYGEHDGFNSTMCGVIEAKVHGSDGTRVASIAHAAVPPFRIENRSSGVAIQFIQDDSDASTFELPPMHSCGYTWDSPLGRQRLRAVAIPKVESQDYFFEGSMHSLKAEKASPGDASKATRDITEDDHHEEGGGSGFDSDESDGDDPCNRSARSVSSMGFSMASNGVVSPLRPDLWRIYGRKSQRYNLSKVGTKRGLPTSSESTPGTLCVHLRISAGTKILSFSDSPWLLEQVELGNLKKGGDFSSALCDVNIDGLSLTIMDDFPRELIGVTVKDVRVHKPMGSIETTATVKHFQVDAYSRNARYPVIVQPKLIGVDRQGHIEGNMLQQSDPASIQERDCFWLGQNSESYHVFEATCSYVPQQNMTWVPNVNVFIAPMKIQLDVDYLLRVVEVIMKASKPQDGTDSNRTTTTRANDQLQYVTYHGSGTSRLTYIEKLFIAPLWFEVEINIKPDDSSESEAAGEAALTLSTIARSTNSATAAGILGWVINVGAQFAHVSPTFRYNPIVCTDQYCDIVELLRDVIISYVIQSIKQSYKVVFSMQLLGDPSLLAHQYRTGISDLVFRTRDELAGGGKNGVGKGLASFSEHVVGGSFFAFGKVTGGFAKTLDSLLTNETTSNHLKPKLAADKRFRPHHAIEGLAQGTVFFGKTLIHGTVGLLGNPYRGYRLRATSVPGSAAGFAKGFVTGVTGLVASPFIGSLGFLAMTADGIGATAKYLELGAIESRCRPTRNASWGKPMSDTGLSFMKAIGIRVHTVRYQKVRKKALLRRDSRDGNEDEGDPVTSKEYKRIRAAEERRKNPPRKVLSILYNKEKRHYVTSSVKPKLLTDNPDKDLSQDRYAVCFEETIILESSDLQLDDEVLIQFRNNRVLKSAPTRSKLSGVCTLSVGDIYSSLLHLHNEQLRDIESNLSEQVIGTAADQRSQTASTGGAIKKTMIVPAPQEYSLFRPAKTKKSAQGDVFDAIGEEIHSIQEADDERLQALNSDDIEYDSDSSFLGGTGRKKGNGDGSNLFSSNERLFGNVSLSFFPVVV